MSTEPTIDQLQAAMNNCFVCSADQRPQAVGVLSALRDLRSTWFGRDENDFRYTLDNFLRGEILT